MLYYSTRNNGQKVSAQMAMKEGLSREGGLYVPESFPALTQADYSYLLEASYVKRAAYILDKFLDDFSLEELETYAQKAYGNNQFDSENTAPVYPYDENTFYLELWHGPTCAFKDMALQMLPHLLTASVKKTGDERTVCILVATSGDTGKAALDGFSDVDGSKIIVFYPKDGVSEIQKLQMITQTGGNVFVSGVDGNFDDAQTGVKNIFTDEAYKEELNQEGIILSSANSINWGRLVPQVVYYISAYCDLVKCGKLNMGDTMNVCVPTGNFGNILAAYYAKKMGLPIGKLICASNRNNVLTDFINTGVYNRNRDFVLTMSPSMDILISSNLERYLYDVCGKNDTYIASLMDTLKKEGTYEVTNDIKEKIRADFYGGFASEEETLAQIHKAFTEKRYLMDTHTAVAAHVLEQYRKETGDHTVCVIASTANPYKFNQSVLAGIGITEQVEDEFLKLEMLEKASGLSIPSQLKALKSMKQRFHTYCEKEDMKQVVSTFLAK